MKYANYILLLLFCSMLASPMLAQKKGKEVLEAEFVVNGNCGMCKERIENAVTVRGVKAAAWDMDSQTLKVIYRSDKITPAEIQQYVADAGHDTEEIKASEEAYAKLHACCLYRENPTCEPKEE